MRWVDRSKMIQDPGARQRFLTGLELHDAGIAMMRQRLRRENPNASENEIDARVSEWLWRGPETRPAREPEREIVITPPRDRRFE